MSISIVPITNVTGSDDPAYQISVGETNTGWQKITQSAAGLLGKSASGDTVVITAGTNLTLSGTTLDASGGGGGSGDMLSTLLNSEVSITSSTTATISKMHVVSGASDWTMTLPAVSGNTGKFIGIRIANSYAKLCTVDGNASEAIDGSLTRIMWAGEACILLCDGSNWFKVAGKSLPMYATLKRTTAQSISAGVWTAAAFTAQDSGVAPMYDSGNGRVKIVRPGTYRAMGMAYTTAGSVPSASVAGYIGCVPNATSPPGAAAGLPSDSGGGVQGYGMMQDAVLAVNDYVNLSVYCNGTSPAIAANTNPAYLSVVEITTW